MMVEVWEERPVVLRTLLFEERLKKIFLGSLLLLMRESTRKKERKDRNGGNKDGKGKERLNGTAGNHSARRECLGHQERNE